MFRHAVAYLNIHSSKTFSGQRTESEGAHYQGSGSGLKAEPEP